MNNFHLVSGARLLPTSAYFALGTDGLLVLPVNFKIRDRKTLAGFGLPTPILLFGAEHIDLTISSAINQMSGRHIPTIDQMLFRQ